VGDEKGQFYLGDSQSGYLLDPNPYLWIIRGATGAIQGSRIIDELTRAYSLSPDLTQSALRELVDLGLMELLPTPDYLDSHSFNSGDGEFAKNINQREINRSERLSIERSLITYRSIDGGYAEWDARASVAISIVGDNRIARNLLPLLIASGFTKSSIAITSKDLFALTARDINALSVSLEHLGRSRALHHRELIRHSRVDGSKEPPHHGLQTLPDLIIATSPPPPDLIAQWQSENLRHLAVGEPTRSDLEISPIIHPGATPCLRCIALHRRDALPESLAPLALPLSATSGAEIPATSAALIAALLASMTENFFAHPHDCRQHDSHSLIINLLEPTLAPRRQRWNFHPECGCVDVRRRALPR